VKVRDLIQLIQSTSYLTFELLKVTDSGKTEVWTIESRDESLLGMIRWHPPWRQYTVFLEDCTIFNNQCLKDIIDVLDVLNKYKRTDGEVL